MSTIDEWNSRKLLAECAEYYEKARTELRGDSSWLVAPLLFERFGASRGGEYAHFTMEAQPYAGMDRYDWYTFAQELSKHIPEALAAVTKKSRERAEKARAAAVSEAREVLRETESLA